MNSFLKAILIVMLTLAVLCSCFGTRAYDFFEAFSDTFQIFEVVSDKALDTISAVMGTGRFELDDRLIVWRYYFDDGNYCDIGFKLTPIRNLANKYFLYSSNKNVKGYYRYKLWRSATSAMWSCVFYGSNVNDKIYEAPLWNIPFEFEGTYKEYLSEYQKDPSKDGWKA